MPNSNHARTWRTSSHSDGGQCVETALDTPGVLVRDSKVTAGPIHTFDRTAWEAFTGAIKPTR
ncbi:DUF397 domain-containing protein (plasmid) [Embleya sp. NBC_00888]|uniref:DUF397 domain-containing protein n=1 Tax=Embleya sp. NBC_00888 TaxID=2975960 RepID=UPI002F91B676|nr:DUF397 domain-containing protein [Embleya sp. NBC_00888]